MRTLAIDFGSRRIGLAMSDDAATLASPYAVLEVSSPRQGIDLVLPIITREGIQRLVVGLPLNMDNTLGTAAREVVSWAKALAQQCNKPLVFVDERLSSFAAEQALAGRKRAGEKLTRNRRKQQLDALAAAGFLQEYLDGKLEPIELAKSM